MVNRRMLSQGAFIAAREYIKTYGRPLEVARFRYHFEGAPVAPVLASLAEFQNADGGFGRALEPDLRAVESSALCSSIAFQVVRATRADPDESLIQAGIDYFLRSLDKAEGHWRIIPHAVQESPHAPWWDQAGREEGFDRFSLNPTAEILGYLVDFQRYVPEETISLLSRRVSDHLIDLEEIEMHDLLCCLRLHQTKALPEAFRFHLQQQLGELIAGSVAQDPALWAGYSLRPLQVIHDPGSPFLEGLETAVDANLDYEIATQNEDGSWAPAWSWGDYNPDVWETARREWSGVITLEKLLVLHRFERIEAVS